VAEQRHDEYESEVSKKESEEKEKNEERDGSAMSETCWLYLTEQRQGAGSVLR
jgi:hypothetical protein